MQLLTLWAQHRLIGIAITGGLLSSERLDFLPAIGTAIPDDRHGN
jgi:hypothetical protein